MATLGRLPSFGIAILTRESLNQVEDSPVKILPPCFAYLAIYGREIESELWLSETWHHEEWLLGDSASACRLRRAESPQAENI